MSDLGGQLRDYVEAVAPSVGHQEITSVQVPARTGPTPTRQYLWFGLALTGLVVMLSLGLLLGGQQVQKSELSAPGDIRACELLIGATARAGQPPGSMTRRHGSTPWNGDVCSHDDWDSGWDFRHILVRTVPTTMEEARLILERSDVFTTFPAEIEVPMSLRWSVEGPGLWTAEARGFHAVAISSEPYFLIVTYRDLGEARAVAEAAIAELENQPTEDS